jgi:antitoxin CptB
MSGPAELGRLRWRCRRGLKELDVLLTRYVNERLSSASDTERAFFDELLDTQDPVLYAYLLGQESPPEQWRALIARIAAQPPGAGR